MLKHWKDKIVVLFFPPLKFTCDGHMNFGHHVLSLSCQLQYLPRVINQAETNLVWMLHCINYSCTFITNQR